MVNFTNTQSRLFITEIGLYRKRSKIQFEKLYKSCHKLQVNGVYTYPLTGRKTGKISNALIKATYSKKDMFDQSGVIFLIENEYYKGIFPTIKESRIVFNINEKNNTHCITMYHILLDDSKKLKGNFTFVIESILPGIDMMSPKLML